MNTTKFQLLEKLRQGKLNQALARSKSITASSAAMPVCSAILAKAKELGIAADEVAQQFVAGKISLPEIDALVGKTSISLTAAASHGLAIAATAAKPATAKPAPKATKPAPPVQMTALSTYRKLEFSDPVAASKFYAQNKSEILRLAGLSDILKSHT